MNLADKLAAFLKLGAKPVAFIVNTDDERALHLEVLRRQNWKPAQVGILRVCGIPLFTRFDIEPNCFVPRYKAL
jgi:hypothetical protein